MRLKLRKTLSILCIMLLCLSGAGRLCVFADPAEETVTAGNSEKDGNADGSESAEAEEVPETAASELIWPGFGADIQAGSAIVTDADTLQILWGRDIHEKRYPASVTKLLTALVVLENCSLSEEVTFSHTAVSNLESGAVTIGAVEGDVLSVKDCLYALLLKSANEVANALAEHVAGSVDAFAVMMNEKAAELGCVDSNFRNPSGLTDPEHVTSAYDMALIACACMNNEDFLALESEPTRKLSGTIKYPDGLTVSIGHKMRHEDSEYYDARVIAGKTGFTSAAGNTLVTMAEDRGRRVVAVVLKDKTPAHYTDTKALLDYGLNSFDLLSPSMTALEEMFSLEQQLVDDGAIPAADEETGAYNTLCFSSQPKITVPLGGGLKDISIKLDRNIFAGKAEDESGDGSGDVPEGAVAKMSLVCLDSVAEPAYIINERTEPPTEETEILSSENREKNDGDTAGGTASEKRGFGVMGWIIAAMLVTACGFAAYLWLQKRAAEKRREERRRKRAERLARIDAKEAAAEKKEQEETAGAAAGNEKAADGAAEEAADGSAAETGEAAPVRRRRVSRHAAEEVSEAEKWFAEKQAGGETVSPGVEEEPSAQPKEEDHG